MMQQAAGASDGQQICDPEMMQQAAGASDGQQICDPEMMQQAAGASDGQQICDPEMMRQAGAVPNQQAYSQKMMQAMLKLMISQQQTMLQMMEIMADLISPSVSQPAGKLPMRHMPGPSFRPGTKSGNHVPFMKQIPDEKKEKMKKAMEPYVSRKVDHPIEQPTVIGITKAKVSKPVKSAEAVLEQVLSALLKNGFSKTEDLFEQGLTSLDTVKIVTRCGEHGYSVKMQDIYMHSTFDELVKCMTPGK
jgi:aryl carrier-like protein